MIDGAAVAKAISDEKAALLRYKKLLEWREDPNTPFDQRPRPDEINRAAAQLEDARQRMDDVVAQHQREEAARSGALEARERKVERLASDVAQVRLLTTDSLSTVRTAAREAREALTRLVQLTAIHNGVIQEQAATLADLGLTTRDPDTGAQFPIGGENNTVILDGEVHKTADPGDVLFCVARQVSVKLFGMQKGVRYQAPYNVPRLIKGLIGEDAT